jgi:hypothetical protein
MNAGIKGVNDVPLVGTEEYFCKLSQQLLSYSEAFSEDAL